MEALMTLAQHFLRLLSGQPSPDKPKLRPADLEKVKELAGKASKRKAEQRKGAP
jgi:hypothetical protein